MSQKLINSYQQFLDGNGNPLAGGSLVFSETGTDTPKTVYSAENQSGSLGSSVDLDSAGRPTSGGGAVEIYSAASGAYRITVKDSSGTNVVVTENVSALLEFSALTMTGQLKLDDSTATATPPLGFDGDTDTGVARPAANTLAFVTGGTERARLDSSGNVGVGTTSPAERLDVVGNAQFGGTDGKLRILSSSVTLDATDSTTPVDVPIDISRSAGIAMFAVGGNNERAVFAYAKEGDFSTGAVGDLVQDDAGILVVACGATNLTVATASSGREGETVNAVVLRMRSVT